MILTLQKIGLTQGEARVYLALLETGLTSVGKIIDISQITSSKVYVILERLERKGLTSHVLKNKVKHFQATNPKRLLDYIEQKRKNLEEEEREINTILPQLLARRKYSTQDTTMYQGSRGIESSLYDFISDLKKHDEYLVFGSSDTLSKQIELIVRQFYVRKAKLGIKTRLIYNVNFKDVKKLYKDIPLTSLRFVTTITPSTIAISKKKILLLAYVEESKAVLVESEQLALSFWNFFESMWKVAKD